MNDCLFCLIKDNKKEIMWENDAFLAKFDSSPVSPGHTLVIPKRHILNLNEFQQEEWNMFYSAINLVMKNIEKTDLKKVYEQYIQKHITDESVWFCNKALIHPRINSKPDAYNHGINDGKAAGKTIDHFHWHIIPRYDGDMDDPRGGTRYVIPGMGNYKISRR